MRVVLDSNVFVSAFLFGGKPRRIVQLAESGEFTLLISAFIREEVERVLALKFNYTPDAIQRATHTSWGIACLIDPTIQVELCRDPADNRILECAIEGEAGYVVTGDRDLLDLPAVTQYRVMTPDAFLKFLELLR